MSARFPDAPTLSKYLAFLHDALTVARSRARPVDDDLAKRLGTLRDRVLRIAETPRWAADALDAEMLQLGRGIIAERNVTIQGDRQINQILEVIHAVPELLCDWPRMREDWQREWVRGYEREFLPNESGRLGRILDEGPRGDWPTPPTSWIAGQPGSCQLPAPP